MRPDDFAPERRRYLVHATQEPDGLEGPDGYWAFVPPPLSSELVLTPGLISDLSAADRALGLLAGVGMRLPNPYLLITPFLRREAVLSSRIEGTQASLSEVIVFEASPAAAAPAAGAAGSPRSSAEVDDVREVVNYVKALEFGVSPERAMPVGMDLMRELHRTLMTGVRGGEWTPGSFRTAQNWLGPAGIALEDAMYVPPPPMHMLRSLRALERYIRDAGELPPLLRLAQIHYQFEAIHPFFDGNGRIGRVLVSLLLQEWGLLPQPLLYLSAFFERRRREYYELLLAVSRDGAWERWLRFFLTGVSEQAMDAVDRSSRLIGLRDDYVRRLQQARASSLALKLVDDLFVHPATSINEAAHSLGVTRRAAQMNVDKLIAAGILTETTGRKRGRVFLAPEVVRLLEEELPRSAGRPDVLSPAAPLA
ncbi:MAG: Fic family protein [Chloroflexi bacterium]|nr:Fic family protein [Chloroflexota bacterium]